jgi:hypothetical protein
MSDLSQVMDRLTALAKRYGQVVLVEPTDLLPRLGEARPHARALGPAELAVIAASLEDAHSRSFALLARFLGSWLGRGPFEYAPMSKRIVAETVLAADRLLLGLPIVRRLGAAHVIWGRPKR